MSDDFQMRRIAAWPLSAKVIYLLLAGDVAEVVCSRDDVDCNRLAVETHTPISAASTASGVGSGPDVAGRWFSVEDESPIFNLAATLDFGDYRLAPVVFDVIFRHACFSPAFKCSYSAAHS